MDDWTLLRNYAREGSETAFAELVKRHVTMVYSVALRQAGGRNDLAEEIAQKTFCLLARKSLALPKRGLLVGWLYRATCNLARETIRTEFRRRLREEKAAQMRSLENDSMEDPLWLEAAPLLDKAIEDLPESERLAIILRFFQAKPMREVALAFGVSEEAAKMRVSRALEKLRIIFKKRGVTVTSLTLLSWLLERSNALVPAELVGILERIPFRTAGAGSSLSFLSKILVFMAKTNLRKASALALLGMLALPVGIKIYQKQTLRERPLADGKGRISTGSSDVQSSLVVEKANHPEISLESALQNLRWALTAPWPNPRKTPVDRVSQALKLFGPNRAAAVPVLMSVFNTPRGERSIKTMVLSIDGLTLLGTDAASVLPDITKLAMRGEIGFMNSLIPKLFLSVDPKGSSVSQLIEGITNPDLGYSSQIQSTIAQLIAENPGSEDTYHPFLVSLLADSKIDSRRRAAFLLARLPGELDAETMPILVDALGLKPLRDPRAYDPNGSDNDTTSRDVERSRDENLRFEAVAALRAAGPNAREALPNLIEVAQLLASTNSFRRYVLEAIGSIAPDYRAESAEVDDQLVIAERGKELAEKAKQRFASFDELLEGLQNPDSFDYAAEALSDLGGAARVALPQLANALDQFNSYEAAQRIKELEPDLLIEQLKQKRLGGLNEIAKSLGELGPKMASALPYLNSILSDMKSDDSNLIAVAEAIQRIDPKQPKMIFHFNDLSEATDALLKRIYDSHKTESPVYQAYITDFQDQNNVGRPQLLKFVEATRSDPDLHRVFVSKLLEKNPILAGDLKE